MNRPIVAPAQPWTFPTARTETLTNGLQVQLFHRPGQHLINATMVIEQPLNAEPPAIEGVAAILRRCLDEGTLSHPGTGYAEELERHGAAIGGGVSLNAAHVSLEVPSTRFADALPLFSEAIIEPALAEADVARHVELRLAEIEQHRAHPVHRVGQEFRAAVVAPQFRAARPTAGSAATVAAINPGQVRDQHQRFFRPGNSTLVLAGDFGHDPLPLIEQTFAAWSGAGPVLDHESPRAGSPAGVLIHRPGAVQANVRLGGFGLDRTDPRLPALRLGTFALGGGFLSRLNRVLREERGYSYGVSLTNTPARSGGWLTFGASFRTEVAVAAIAEAKKLMSVRGAAITATELGDAVNFLIGVTPLRCATAAGVTDQVAGLVEVGLDADFVNRHSAALQQVSPADATAAVAELLPTDALTMVVVGDADTLAEPLKSLAPDLQVIDDRVSDPSA